jgi:plastocyanin
MIKPKDFGARVKTSIARRTVLRVVLAVALAAAGATQALAEGAEAKVTIDNFTFAPAEITISAGTTVTWENRDDIPHTVVEKNKLFRSKALDTGDSYSFTFTSAGTYDYFCGLHPHMVGKIIVKP